MKLSCPITQFPRNGVCQSRYSDIYFLAIEIAYRLRLNLNRSRYGARDGQNYNDKDLGIALRGQLYNDLDLEQCGRCTEKLYQSFENEKVGNTRLPLYYDFLPFIYTNDRPCSLDVILDSFSKIIGQGLNVTFGDEEYITYDIEEMETVREFKKNASKVDLPPNDKDDKLCTARNYLSYRDVNKCPMVRLDATYYPSLMKLAGTAAKARLVNALFDMSGRSKEPKTLSTGPNRTDVCWAEYKALVEMLVPHLKGFASKHSGNTFCISMIFAMTILILI